jgi:hypothetical protein
MARTIVIEFETGKIAFDVPETVKGKPLSMTMLEIDESKPASISIGEHGKEGGLEICSTVNILAI